MLDSVTKQIRCAIYTRKSSDEGLEQEFNSLDAQRESCEAYIRSQQHEGWIALPTFYDDGGFSGGSLNRPAMQQLLKDIKAGLVDTVVVYKVDRLTRSLMDFAKIVEIFDTQGASFVSVTQQFNTTTSMGRLTLNVLLSFAQFEREVTGERIRDKVAQSKAKGMWTGGCVPLGYDIVDKKLIINPAEAETIRRIFNRYLELGCVQKLQAELESEGIQSKHRVHKDGKVKGGQRFSRSALYQILRNRIYAGEISHRENVYEAQHEGIIDKASWSRVQEALTSSAVTKKFSVYAKSPALLAGLVYDDKGNRLTSTHSNKKGVRYRYYTSQAILQYRRDQSGVVTRVPADPLETAILDEVKRLLSDSPTLMDAISGSENHLDVTHSLILQAQQYADGLDTLQPNHIRKILSVIVVRVDITPDKLVVKFTRCGIRDWLNGGSTVDTVEPPTNNKADLKDELVRDIPIKLQQLGRRTKLILEQSFQRPQINDSLIKAVLRAHGWRDELLSGKARSIQEIAGRENLPQRYTARILRLAFLAPDIVEAILEGRQSQELTVEILMNEMLINWGAQRRAFQIHRDVDGLHKNNISV